MFSFGVILFIIVQGIFPFKEARKEEYFYNLICSKQTDLYFQKTNAANLSLEFKDLILALFNYDAAKRPSISQIRAHPWFNKAGFSLESTRQQLLAKIKLTRPAENLMTKPVKVGRKV